MLLTVGPGEPLIDRTRPRPGRGARKRARHDSPTSPTPTCWTPSRPRGCRSCAASGRRSARPSGPRRRSPHTVLAGALAAIERSGPDAVIQGGDLIDNAQGNELEQALALLAAGSWIRAAAVRATSACSRRRTPIRFYYRPDIDAPRHPGMLAARGEALPRPGPRRRSVVPGARRPRHPRPGRAAAETADAGVRARRRARSGTCRRTCDRPRGSPRGQRSRRAPAPPPTPSVRPARSASCSPSPGRRPASRSPPTPPAASSPCPRSLARLRGGAPPADAGPLLDYAFDIGERGAGDRARPRPPRRRFGRGGAARPAGAGSPASSPRAGERWVIVVGHQPLTSSAGGEHAARAARPPPAGAGRALGPHAPQPGRPARRPAGGYWLIASGSLIDFPQQLRAMRVRETAGGGVALEAWMLDHVPDGGLGDISRQLSYLDAQGGRPQGFAGGPRTAMCVSTSGHPAPENPRRRRRPPGARAPRTSARRRASVR